MLFDDSNVNSTVDGKRKLGAILGSDGYKHEYFDKLVKDYNGKPTQGAHSAFVSGFKNKLSFFMRTIPDISNLLPPIKDIIRNWFIPAITGGFICNEEERKLLSLSTRYRGIAIPIFHEQVEVEYNNSRRTTAELTSLITVWEMEYKVDKLMIKKIKVDIKAKNITITNHKK